MKKLQELYIKDRPFIYRLFEIFTPLLTYSIIIITIILSIFQPLIASIYILVMISLFFVKGLGVLYSSIRGRNKLHQAVNVDWHQRLQDLAEGKLFHEDHSEFEFEFHKKNVKGCRKNCLKVDDIYNVVIIAAYNESYEVIKPTIQSLLDTTFNKDRLIICLAYEERGGKDIESVARKLKDQYKHRFADFVICKHPKDLPNEVVGKGGNITYAGRMMSQYLKDKNIKSSNVIVTTLDSDNKPHSQYFDCVTYHYAIFEDRKQLSFQPISLFLNNIWDVPAPIRVVATGNSFWNIICSNRPYMLRNFASHSQPMDAIEEMDYWSVKTIVEDGHQFWRSYFHFEGQYNVVPIYVPIYQDAVLSADGLRKTLKAQFVQLRRWAYGVSDIPYIMTNTLARYKSKNFTKYLASLMLLIESHVSLPIMPLIITFGGWAPLLLGDNIKTTFAVHQLPSIISSIQALAMIGLIVTIFFSLSLLPPRPKRYSKLRSFMMILQWLMIPVITIFYNSLTALYSQTRLLLGLYLDKFDVTEKTVVK